MTEKVDLQFDSQKLRLMQEKLIAFIRHLAAFGFQIDIDLQVTAQTLLAENNFGDRFHLLNSLRTLLCKNKQQWETFEEIYTDFWLTKAKMEAVKRKPKSSKPQTQVLDGDDSDNSGETLNQPNNKESESSASQSLSDLASAKELNEKIDFAFLDNEKMLHHFTESCHQLAKLLSRKLRKNVRTPKGERIDLRQSIQHNLKHGGNLVELVWLKRPKVLPKFTLLIDVSRSMSGYSNAFLVFALAIVRALPSTRVFMFNTRLIDITNALRENQLHRIKTQLALLNTTWGGGTRIAHSIAQLQKQGTPSKRSAHHLIVHSDGLDTDPVTDLQERLKTMQKQYRSIIWLSPLMKDTQYQVETAALKGALPYINYLLPVHDFTCLYRLTDLMLGVDIPLKQSAGAAHVS